MPLYASLQKKKKEWRYPPAAPRNRKIGSYYDYSERIPYSSDRYENHGYDKYSNVIQQQPRVQQWQPEPEPKTYQKPQTYGRTKTMLKRKEDEFETNYGSDYDYDYDARGGTYKHRSLADKATTDDVDSSDDESSVQDETPVQIEESTIVNQDENEVDESQVQRDLEEMERELEQLKQEHFNRLRELHELRNCEDEDSLSPSIDEDEVVSSPSNDEDEVASSQSNNEGEDTAGPSNEGQRAIMPSASSTPDDLDMFEKLWDSLQLSRYFASQKTPSLKGDKEVQKRELVEENSAGNADDANDNNDGHVLDPLIVGLTKVHRFNEATLDRFSEEIEKIVCGFNVQKQERKAENDATETDGDNSLAATNTTSRKRSTDKQDLKSEPKTSAKGFRKWKDAATSRSMPAMSKEKEPRSENIQVQSRSSATSQSRRRRFYLNPFLKENEPIKSKSYAPKEEKSGENVRELVKMFEEHGPIKTSSNAATSRNLVTKFKKKFEKSATAQKQLDHQPKNIVTRKTVPVTLGSNETNSNIEKVQSQNLTNKQNLLSELQQKNTVKSKAESFKLVVDKKDDTDSQYGCSARSAPAGLARLPADRSSSKQSNKSGRIAPSRTVRATSRNGVIMPKIEEEKQHYDDERLPSDPSMSANTSISSVSNRSNSVEKSLESIKNILKDDNERHQDSRKDTEPDTEVRDYDSLIAVAKSKDKNKHDAKTNSQSSACSSSSSITTQKTEADNTKKTPVKQKRKSRSLKKGFLRLFRGKKSTTKAE